MPDNKYDIRLSQITRFLRIARINNRKYIQWIQIVYWTKTNEVHIGCGKSMSFYRSIVKT